jgi:hypothetical protein
MQIKPKKSTWYNDKIATNQDTNVKTVEILPFITFFLLQRLFRWFFTEKYLAMLWLCNDKSAFRKCRLWEPSPSSLV